MSTWNIYHKDDTKLSDENGKEIVVHSLEYSDTWMGECFVTITFENEAPIDFAIGDYIEYRGEKFEINYDPGKIKVSSKNSYGAAFKYDSVKFNSLSDELARCEFLDVVLNDNNLHYTALPKFSFYVSSLDDLLDRILANLNEQIGENEWKLFSRNLERSKQRGCTEAEWNEMYGEGTEDNTIESKSITIDQKTCWEALALVNSEWDVNFIVRGRNVYVGTAGLPTANIFKYGKGNGLYEIEQNSESDQSVVTRLRAYGSGKNLPNHYYADFGTKLKASISSIATKSSYIDMVLDLDYLDTYFKTKHRYSIDGGESYNENGWVLTVTFDYSTIITGYVTKDTNTKKCRFYSEFKGSQDDNGDESSATNLATFISQCEAGKTLYITSGLYKTLLPSENKEVSENLPNNMACSRLMLPGFPNQSLQEYWDSLTDDEKKYANPGGKEHKFSTNQYRPYIDSLNIDDIGTRQGSAYFDTDDEANGIIEIYPTMEEMTTSTGQRLDEIYKGSEITDDGRFDDGQTVANFTLLLRPEIDFDINDLKQSDFTICMKDGMCGGREFSVNASSIDYETGCWELTLSRQKDDALEIYFPYKDYQINAGDHFVLTGIELPDSYIKAASLKLLKWAIAYLDENDYTRYVYQPKVDEIFMARQHDKYLADTTGTVKSLYLTLKAGDLLSFEDSDLNIEGEVSIDSLSIKEDEGKIPTYEVTLREDKEVGTIKKIQNQVSSLVSANGASGGGITSAQTKSIVQSEGDKYFLNKVTNDSQEVKGVVTFDKEVSFKGGVDISSSLTVSGDTSLQDVEAKGNTKLGENGTQTTFGNYVADSTGASVKVDSNGTSYIEADYLTIRRAADFREITIRELKHIGGELAITPAAMEVSKVERLDADKNIITDSTTPSFFKCYFETTGSDGKKKVYQEFIAGDQARCQQFGIQEGTHGYVRTKYYWMLVTEVGTNYIMLSNSVKDEGSTSEPDVNDNIVQLGYCGNTNIPSRQAAIILSAAANDAPSQKYYQGINDFSLDHVVKDEGYNVSSGTFHSNVYGDSFVGDKDGNGYLQYDSKSKTMTFKGTAHFDSDTTVGDETIATKSDLQNLNIKSGNILRNTSFTGNYESVDVSEDTDMSEDTETYSDRLLYWELSGVSVLDSEDVESGKAASISNGYLSQTMTQALLKGGEYTLSFKGKGTTVTIETGGNTIAQEMGTDMQRYEIHFQCTDNSSLVFKMSGESCTIGEIMLSYGNISPAWSPAYSDNDKSLAEFQSLKFLTDAITEGSTTVDGGLVMSQQFRVGNYRDGKMTKETGGMSGYYNGDNSAFLWGGGTLEQAIYTIQKYKDNPSYQATEDEIANMAKFVVTHGGRAILNDIVLRGIIYAEGGVMKSIKSPNGNFSIDDTGNATLKGEIDAYKGTIGGFKINENSIGSISQSTGDIDYSDKDEMTLFDNSIIFNGKSRQAIIGQWSSLGTPILMRLIDEIDDTLTRFGAVISVKNHKGGACAIGLGGGYVSGFGMKTKTFNSKSLTIGRDVNVALLMDTGQTYVLPDMQPYDDGHMVMVKSMNGKCNLKVGSYTKYDGTTPTPYILYDQGSHTQNLLIEGKCDAMIFVFSTAVSSDDGEGCWVQFKCPRDW